MWVSLHLFLSSHLLKLGLTRIIPRPRLPVPACVPAPFWSKVIMMLEESHLISYLIKQYRKVEPDQHLLLFLAHAHANTHYYRHYYRKQENFNGRISLWTMWTRYISDICGFFTMSNLILLHSCNIIMAAIMSLLALLALSSGEGKKNNNALVKVILGRLK